MSVKRHYKNQKYILMRKQTKEALQHLAQTMVESDSYISLRGTAKFIEWALRLHKMTGSYVTAQTIRTHQQDLEEMCQIEMLKRNPLNKGIVVPKQFDDDVDNDFDDDDYDAFEDEEFYWACGDMVDHDTVIRRALELIESRMDAESAERLKSLDEFFTEENLKKAQEDFIDLDDFEPSQRQKFDIQRQQSMAQQIANTIVKSAPVKNYSMFIESEDGLRIIRGEYKGRYVSEIDAQRWAGCAIGWSRYQLKQNEELGANRQGALTDDDKNVFLDIISGKDV